VVAAHHVPFVDSRRLAAAAALAALLAGLTGCIEGKGTVKVTAVKLNGVKSVKPAAIKSVLATTPSSKLPWGATHYFTREQFESDLKRIVAFYKDRGYPDAKVSSFDVKMNDRQDAVAVSINVDEGQPILVERIAYEGFDALPPEHLAELKGRIALKEHAPLDRALAQASRESALDEVRDHGYPYASVRLTEQPGSDEHARVLTFSATPGTQARYGDINIDGNSSVSDNVVRRQLTIRPGRLFRLSQLQESQRRLYDLETFQFANVEADVKEGEQPAIVPIKTTLTEGKHRKVNFGAGYGSEEHARVSMDWRHVNFFGAARTLQFESQYSALNRGARLSFRQPYLFGPRTDIVFTAQSWHRNEPSYILNTNGGKVTIEHRLARRGPLSQRQSDTRFSLTYTDEFQNYRVSELALATPSFLKTLISLGLDPLNGTARGLLSSVALDLNRRTSDSTLDPHQGYLLTAHLEQAGRALRGDYEFTEATMEGRYYVPIAGRAVLAVRAHGGSIGQIGSADNLKVPFYRRYFLGGATSLRGWGRFEVSPLFFGAPTDPGGITVGGHSMFESSAELRVPVLGNLTAVLFADGGNVWNNAWSFKLGDMRYDAGPGLRYLTPLGPIRVDVGFQLNRVPGLLIDGKPETRHFRVHFSIGQAF
jgi:outer membrane protein assembly complex protein YaeT